MAIDRDLLFLSGENARGKIKDLALAVKKSPQLVKYSLRTMEEEGQIYLPHCIFDYSYFGLILFRVYFKGGYISEHDKTEIINKLKENKYIVTMYELYGEFDLALEIVSPNPSRFTKELRKVAGLIPTLNNYKILLNVVTHLYPRSYLLKNQELFPHSKEIIVGGDRAIETFTEQEMAVMKCLLARPKIRLTTLAKEANLHVKTVQGALQNLYKRKIIKGYKQLINTDKLEIHKSRLFLRLHNFSQERETDLLNYLSDIKEVVQVNKTVGDWNMEIDIESFNNTKVRYIVLQIRERFKDIIETFNTTEFFQYYTKSYLPRYLFEQEE